MRTAAGVVAISIAWISSSHGQAIRQEPPNPEATSGAIQRRAAPPARILKFDAQPGSIKPGEAVMLEWAVENPNSTSIDQNVGPVRPQGSRQVSPAVTTTYTLTTVGPNGAVTRAVTVKVAGTKEVVAATTANVPLKVPQMPDGKPDFSGVYNNRRGGAAGRTPEARAEATAAAPQLKPGAEKFKVVRGPDDAGLYSDCMPTGVPNAFGVGYPVQFIQSEKRMSILFEYPGIFRVVLMDGSPHPKDPDPTWMGDSRGHWEGDTLVVDTIGFNEKAELPGGYRHTDALHVIERFRRPDYDTIQYEATIEDPNVFKAPWKWNLTFGLRRDLDRVDEFVCENNRDYRPFFKKQQ